jgi:hypothetical protein
VQLLQRVGIQVGYSAAGPQSSIYDMAYDMKNPILPANPM